MKRATWATYVCPVPGCDFRVRLDGGKANRRRDAHVREHALEEARVRSQLRPQGNVKTLGPSRDQ